MAAVVKTSVNAKLNVSLTTAFQRPLTYGMRHKTPALIKKHKLQSQRDLSIDTQFVAVWKINISDRLLGWGQTGEVKHIFKFSHADV
uniref:Uncharacterized protein n=1 Tax=Romanomermis culicivorax TaxID=13658 RepID=A0A915JVT6_ROMCU